MKKITQTTLAEMLNISRTTVARALNNHPCVDENTRKIILDKANELGYLQPSQKNNKQTYNNSIKEIALLGHVNSMHIIFWVDILHGLEQYLRSQNINLRLLLIDNKQIITGHLPDINSYHGVSGIVIIGDMPRQYFLSLGEFGIPIVSYDMPFEMATTQPIMDVISANNSAGIQLLTKRIIEKGHRKLCFVGSTTASASFYERYQGFENTMQLYNLEPIDIKSLRQIKPSTSRINEEEFYNELMNTPPEKRATAYICANDTIAESLYSFKEKYHDLIGDIILTGFDNTPTNAHILDGTVDMCTKQIGELLGIQMCMRIANPTLPNTITRLNVTPIFHNKLK